MRFNFRDIVSDEVETYPEDVEVTVEITYSYHPWSKSTCVELDFYAMTEDGLELVFDDSNSRNGRWNIYDLLEDGGYFELLTFIDEIEPEYDEVNDSYRYAETELN